MLTLLLIVGGLLIVLVDAIICARRQGREYQLKRYNRWYVYVGFFVAVQAATLLLAGVMIRNSFVQAFVVPTGSMSPTIRPSDRIVAGMWEYAWFNPITGQTLWRHSHPQRGDVVIFLNPQDTNTMFVKRVMGLPGDTLEMRQHRIWINGEPLDEPFLTPENTAVINSRYAEYGPIQIEQGKYFLVGDRRNVSLDSRVWGAVSENLILGRVHCIYFSRQVTMRDVGQQPEYEFGPVQWDRIGTVIE